MYSSNMYTLYKAYLHIVFHVHDFEICKKTVCFFIHLNIHLNNIMMIFDILCKKIVVIPRLSSILD